MREFKLTTDAVVFTVKHDDLKILLIKRKKPPFKGKYALPGGHVEQDEELDDAAKRELKEETNVKDIFLKQIGTYGEVGRDPRGRYITVAYLALISAEQNIIPSDDAEKAEWFSIDYMPDLAFDHEKIIHDAISQLRYEIQTTNIAYQILPQKFTLTQLQQLYELVLNKKLDKRNFRKRINELNILIETGQTLMEGAHRPAQLYTFRDKRYANIRDKINVFLK